MIDAVIAQAPQPGEDRPGIEAELRDDVDARARSARRLRAWRRAGGRVRGRRCADGRRDSPRCRSRTMPRREISPELIASSAPWNGPAGSARSPAITSRRRTPASPFSRSRKCSERVGGGEVAHRQMRHRLEPGRAHARRLLDHVLLRPRRHGAEIDRRAGRGRGLQRSRHPARRPRRFERAAAHECGDRRDGFGARRPPARSADASMVASF